jgi:VWFA-related protein
MTKCFGSTLAAVVALCTYGAGQQPAGAAPAQSGPLEGTRHVYISALDRKGTPVTDLSDKEVSVREDGADREVVAVQRATAPLEIALLVDDTGPGLRFIREGVGGFIQRLGGLAQIALVSTAGQNSVLVDFTGRVDVLYQGVRQLVTRTTSGAYLLDGVGEAIKALNGREAERPVIVVVTLEGAEFSSVRADRLLEELQRSRAILHVISLGKPTLKTMTGWNEMPSQSLRENLDENINRKKFLEDGSRQSGGTLEQVLADSGIPGALHALAENLASQYVVVYRRPEGPPPPKKMTVAVKRAGVKVRVRTEPPRGAGSK